MKIQTVLLVYAYECDTVDIVKTVLKNKNINCKATKRDFLNAGLFHELDLIITIGGDGTFLRTAHHIRESTPILGINCDVRSNVGFFMRATRDDFEDKFGRMLTDNFDMLKLTRLEGIIDNRKLPEFALNEFFAGDQKSYQVARYRIYIDGKEELQMSSGVIVATAAGSHGWAKSAAGFYIPLESNKFQYLVREPYQGRLSGKYALVKALLNPGQEVRIVSEMKNGIVVADSNSTEYPFKPRSVLIVRTTKRVLNVVTFLNG